jgi:hypothetical protein
METLDKQKGGRSATSPEGVKKLFPFVVTRSYKKYSGWYEAEVTFTEYGFKKGRKTYWFGRRTSDLDQDYNYDDILVILTSLKKNKFAYACNYCGKGGLGSPNKFTNLTKFLWWVKRDKHQFDSTMTSFQEMTKGHWRFIGNLVSYSCAFWFDIFDEELHKEIMESVFTLK